MKIILPQLPDVKNGQMDAEELRRFLYALQLVIKEMSEKIT
jgi:hypothetical protein